MISAFMIQNGSSENGGWNYDTHGCRRNILQDGVVW